MSNRLWILGAADPEMTEIETVIKEFGEAIDYATIDGRRVNPGEAYLATGPDVPVGAHVVLVECNVSSVAHHLAAHPSVVVIDHHRPGDPGYGRPPAEYLDASSLGQVLTLLGLEATVGQRVAAAADHCLAAAYAGQCPGINPEHLYEHRLRNVLTAEAPGRPARSFEDVLGARRIAEKAMLEAPIICMGGVGVLDLRGRHVPDLPEHACRYGKAYLASPPPRPGERAKIVLGGAGEGTVAGTRPVEAFLAKERAGSLLPCCDPYTHGLAWSEHAGPSELLEELYGDPVRGFAGGYLPA